MGGFRSVEVTQGEVGPLEMIYQTHIGPYSNLYESWSKFQVAWETAGLEICDSLAVYLDPPGTPEEKLRSIIGCRIDQLSEEMKIELASKFPTFAFPKSRAILSSFPFINTASYFLAPMKVYPAFQKIMEKERFEAPVGVEFYGVADSATEIRFAMPIDLEKSDFQPLIDSAIKAM